MRTHFLLILVAILIFGCARTGTIPTDPGFIDGSADQSRVSAPELGEVKEISEPHRLWGNGMIYISEDHSSAELVPNRRARVHLNALKFLEDQDPDCVLVTDIHSNGDVTIDLTLEITNPFYGMPEFTVFDVKGILMFRGSHIIPIAYERYPLYPQDYRLSWRYLGDPEVLNADGYTHRWSPWYDSGSDLPIFSYWPGKYAGETPTANVNAYLDFYSNEERHMLEVGKSVERVYHIALPPGTAEVGYAVEVCWEPPINMPVTNPVDDFPITANMPECYSFNIVWNDGEVIDSDQCCGWKNHSVYENRIEIEYWYLPEDPGYLGIGPWAASWSEEISINQIQYATDVCDSTDPAHWRCINYHYFFTHPNGIYQLIGIVNHDYEFEPYYHLIAPAFTIYEIEIDIN